MGRRILKSAWEEASPTNPYRAGAWWSPPAPSGFTQLVAVLRFARRIEERGKALVHLIRPDEGCDYLGCRARIHAALLLLLPIRWHYPEFRNSRGRSTYCDEVTSWDGSAWNGGEQTCWEATFIATRRWGFAHIYREGGP